MKCEALPLKGDAFFYYNYISYSQNKEIYVKIRSDKVSLNNVFGGEYLNTILKIKALKYPNIPHYEWEGEILEKTPDYILVLCKSGRKLIHHTKNEVYTINNSSVEYFPFNKWFTAAMEVDEGVVVSNYCNIAMPSVLNENELSFIDLDLDLVKRKNHGWEVVDEDEFEMNSRKYHYSQELKIGAIQALDQLQEEIAKGNFPFINDFTSVLEK